MGLDFTQGFATFSSVSAETLNDVTVVVRNWFANRTPMVTRLRNVPVGTASFQMFSHKYRSRTYALSANIANNTVTTLSITNCTALMNHDVLQITDGSGNYERIQLTADPTITNTTTGAGTISVTRGVSSTTPISSATYTNTTQGTLTLIGNSRTGSEITQTGLSSTAVATTQYTQNFQFPVQVGGSAQSTRLLVVPEGVETPFDRDKMMQLQNMMDDIEVSTYYGLPDAPVGTTTTGKMAGFRNLIVTNNIGPFATSSATNGAGSTPVNAAAYRPQDLIRDVLQPCRVGGGNPDLMLMSQDWMQGLATWGMAVQRIDAGETIFGEPIKVFRCPFLEDIDIIEAPLLNFGTVAAFTSEEIYERFKRNPFWNPRATRGDAFEGEWIAEVGCQVENESHHAWVEGITGFSAN